jgi:hypothetical protein
MDGWKQLTLAYACLYAVFVYWVYGDNSPSYPLAYVIASCLVQTLVAGGLFAWAFGKGPRIARAWRWLFPLMVLDVIAGICADAIVPTDFNLAKDGMAWVANLLLNLWFLAPAYYLNFKIAYRGRGT